jgi:hypothetical protein
MPVRGGLYIGPYLSGNRSRHHGPRLHRRANTPPASTLAHLPAAQNAAPTPKPSPMSSVIITPRANERLISNQATAKFTRCCPYNNLPLLRAVSRCAHSFFQVGHCVDLCFASCSDITLSLTPRISPLDLNKYALDSDSDSVRLSIGGVSFLLRCRATCRGVTHVSTYLITFLS